MKRLLKFSLTGIILITSGVGLVFCIAAFVVLTSPNVQDLKGCLTTTMFHVEVCPGSSRYVKLSQVPENLVDALIVSEDAAFYGHSGFDWFELRESLEKNLEHKSFKRGGSTLTQQLAKNAFLSSEKSIWRKIKEAYITYRIEKIFSKDEILEKYLNIVEFGDNIYGIKKAANFYFNKEPQDLHLLESAFLVMLLPSPKKYSQSFRDGELTPFAKKMIHTILGRLVRYKKISPEIYSFAKENIDMFPWRHLSQSDFRFFLPELPGDLTGTFETEESSAEGDTIDEEIKEQSDDTLLGEDVAPEELPTEAEPSVEETEDEPEEVIFDQ